MQGKVAIITGGGGGIGSATALRFAEEGAKVAVFDIDPQLGERSAKIATTAACDGGGAMFVNVDVTDADSVRAGVNATISAYGEINTCWDWASRWISRNWRFISPPMKAVSPPPGR